MDVLIDTNVVFSAALFPNPRTERFLSVISEKHNLFICEYGLSEIRRVTARKFPARVRDMESFMRNLRYTVALTPKTDVSEAVNIRDADDYPILSSAIAAGVDILITGDRDFESVSITRPEILTISEFMKKYAEEPPGV